MAKSTLVERVQAAITKKFIEELRGLGNDAIPPRNEKLLQNHSKDDFNSVTCDKSLKYIFTYLRTKLRPCLIFTFLDPKGFMEILKGS